MVETTVSDFALISKWSSHASSLAPSKVSTSNDACDDHLLISAKSETLLSRPLSASMYTNFV